MSEAYAMRNASPFACHDCLRTENNSREEKSSVGVDDDVHFSIYFFTLMASIPLNRDFFPCSRKIRKGRPYSSVVMIAFWLMFAAILFCLLSGFWVLMGLVGAEWEEGGENGKEGRREGGRARSGSSWWSGGVEVGKECGERKKKHTTTHTHTLKRQLKNERDPNEREKKKKRAEYEERMGRNFYGVRGVCATVRGNGRSG